MASCNLLPFSTGSQHLLMEAQFVLEIAGGVNEIEIPRANPQVSRAFLWKNQAVPMICLRECLSLEGLGEGRIRTLILKLAAGVVAVGADSVGAVIKGTSDMLSESKSGGLPFLPVQMWHDGVNAHLLDVPSLVDHLLKKPEATGGVQ